MQASPLVQDERLTLRPKIAQLYDELFTDENTVDQGLSEGFWREFFLLKPDSASLRARIDQISADELLHFHYESRQLFAEAVRCVKHDGSPYDENALDTLTIFLSGILSKRYTNPSSDIITVLSGINEVDKVFGDFALTIDNLIRSARTSAIKEKAIHVCLAFVCGAYQTSLISYFTHRNLFPVLTKYVQSTERPEQTLEPIILLGLLANYNKFEIRNPYRVRLEDFVNGACLEIFANGFGRIFTDCRNEYLNIMEDQVGQSWSIKGTLSAIGLGILAPAKTAAVTLSVEDANERFAGLPAAKIAALPAFAEFIQANKMFCSIVMDVPSKSKSIEQPFSAYLSLVSYMGHHAYRSARASLYTLLAFAVLRVFVEDQTLCKRSVNSAIAIDVRLCRQRQPFLPLTTSPRPLACHIIDISVDTLNHNLRKRLDGDLYVAALDVILRLVICLAQTRTQLDYHWSILWQSLFSLIKFFQAYASDLKTQNLSFTQIFTPLTRILALAVAAGSGFMPTTDAYDDLIYKIVEQADTIKSFAEAYGLLGKNSATDAILATATHFRTLLDAEQEKGRLKSMSSKEVNRVIRNGYESFQMPDPTQMDWDRFELWRESDERGMLKQVVRLAVDEAKTLTLAM